MPALEGTVLCIMGLGYVGLPLALAFQKELDVIGFDTDPRKLESLRHRYGDTERLIFTDEPGEIRRADAVIICVPTPVTETKEPDLSYVTTAGRIAGTHLKRGTTVILESTVYPGVTEGILQPAIEETSGLACGRDFRIGYSPERINPGDNEHGISQTIKVVAGMDEPTTEFMARLYSVVTSNVYQARDIKTAEAAKVIENIQRDLNIALVNELSVIFEKMGLRTRDVLEAAATKWNFHRYTPGLVGGHCIPVDPYYLVHRARELGYEPQVILAGRSVNENMPAHVAEMTEAAMNEAGKAVKGARVLIMGLTYKEDVDDTRENPVKKLIRVLQGRGIEVAGYDPLLEPDRARDEFGISIRVSLAADREMPADGVVLTLAHTAFRTITLQDLAEVQTRPPVLVDVRGLFTPEDAGTAGFCYRTL